MTADIASWVLNWYLIAGVALHAVGFVLLVLAFKRGNLSILYPVLATSYVWVPLLSHRYLGETISVAQWVGVGLIIAGIGLIVR